MSKRQGSTETSTYGTEFCVIYDVIEETISIRHVLCCLGIKVNTTSLICGENKGVVQNSTISDSLLKKKHVAITCHKIREVVAIGIIHPIKVSGQNNFSDLITKALTGKTF